MGDTGLVRGTDAVMVRRPWRLYLAGVAVVIAGGFTPAFSAATSLPHVASGPTVSILNDSSFNDPIGIAADGTYVWVANDAGGSDDDGSVSKIDEATGTVSDINDESLGALSGIADDGTDVWVTNEFGGINENGSVSKINIATGVVTEIDSATFDGPTAIASDGTDVWVANEGEDDGTQGSVSKINIATDVVTDITSPGIIDPDSIASNGTDVWVGTQDGGPKKAGSISEINVATGAVTEIDNSALQWVSGLAVDASNVWAANMFGGTTSSGSISKIDTTTSNLTTLNSSNFGGMTGIATNGTDVWASNSLGGSSALGSVTDTKVATGKTTQILSTTFNWPTAIAATANDLWVTNEYGGSEGNGSVSVISLSSSGTSIGTKTTVPGRPTGVRATAGAASAAVTWKAPVSNGGSPITGYAATATPGGKICTAKSTTCTVTGLASGKSYTFTVVAKNQYGASPASSASNKIVAKTKSTNGTAPGQPPRTRIPLRYSLPADVQNLSFTVGETLPAGISYCLPAVNVDFGQCGGSSTKDQVQPYGGVKVDGPYHFTLTLESTLPAGLLLHSNGALTGTVSSEDDAKTYPFTICVSEVGVAPSQGNTDTVCRATKVVITPATIEADPIVGTWTNTSNGHVVVIEASGSGFVGIDETTYLSGPCTFSAGEQVWQINAQGSDGTYSGEDQGVTYTVGGDASTCIATPFPTTWTVTGPVNGEFQLTADYYTAGTSTTDTRPASG